MANNKQNDQLRNAEYRPPQGYCSDPHAVMEARQLLSGQYIPVRRLLLEIVLIMVACETAVDLVVNAIGLRPPWDTTFDSLAVAVLIIPIFYFMIARPYVVQLRRTMQLGQALLEANRQLCQTAITDELTGLYNRRGFLEVARHHFNAAKRYERPLSVLYCDLDCLKIINDKLGHDAGDQAIKDAADALAGSVRESDICGRLGGDEFAILLPQSNLDAAQGTIHRIQSALDALNAGRKPPIGISMGARELDHKNMRSVDELLAEADAEMYRVKHARKALAGLHGGQKGPCGMEDLLALADAEMNRAKAVRKNEPPHAPQAQG